MASPEWNILNRFVSMVRQMAANDAFVPYYEERVRTVIPAAIDIRKAVGAGLSPSSGHTGMILPAILITPLPVDTTIDGGLNCADDEVVRIAVQIVDSSINSVTLPLRSYSEWMGLIRAAILANPNPFLQDADPAVYDPYVVHILKRVPAEAQSLIRHEQQVAVLTFQVMVRHHR